MNQPTANKYEKFFAPLFTELNSHIKTSVSNQVDKARDGFLALPDKSYMLAKRYFRDTNLHIKSIISSSVIHDKEKMRHARLETDTFLGFNDEIYNRMKGKYILDVLESQKIKLTHVIEKYLGIINVAKVEKQFITANSLGFEGVFKVTDDQGNVYTFDTKAIGAGGYNIQEFHYRYLADLIDPNKKSLRKRINQLETDMNKAAAAQKQMERKLVQDEKQLQMNVKKWISNLYEAKRDIELKWSSLFYHPDHVNAKRWNEELNASIERIKPYYHVDFKSNGDVKFKSIFNKEQLMKIALESLKK